HHHERLDGSGYHRGAPAARQTPPPRILAAADVYQALTEPRLHRPAHSPDAAADVIRRAARAGRLAGDAPSGAMARPGRRVRPARREAVVGLSERKLEVVRLLAGGNSMKQMAGRLSNSEKTVDTQIQHIYAKIGVSTRAAAPLFAMEQDLLAE